jgi:hypothetical protein
MTVAFFKVYVWAQMETSQTRTITVRDFPLFKLKEIPLPVEGSDDQVIDEETENLAWYNKVKFDGFYAYYNWVLTPIWNWIIMPVYNFIIFLVTYVYNLYEGSGDAVVEAPEIIVSEL